jgi:hypothetical protein
MRSLVVILAVSAMSGCKPTCDDVDHQLTKIVVTEAEHAGSDAGRPFLPLLDTDGVQEIVGRCRAGALSDDAIRCLVEARRASDVDRCSRHGL